MASQDVEDLLRWSLASFSVAAGILHTSAAADHRRVASHLAFFLAVAALQSASALVLLRSPARRWITLTVAFNAAVVLVWGLSRTTGLPGVDGAATAELIGFKDGIATLLELAIITGAGLLVVLPEAARRVVLPTAPLASAVIAAGVWGLGVSGLMAGHEYGSGHLHGDGGHSGDELVAAHGHPGEPIGGDPTELAHGGSDTGAHAHPAPPGAGPGPAGTDHTDDAAHADHAAHAVHDHAGSEADGTGHSPVHRHGAAELGPAAAPGDPAEGQAPVPAAGGGHEHEPGADRPDEGHEHEPGRRPTNTNPGTPTNTNPARTTSTTRDRQGRSRSSSAS